MTTPIDTTKPNVARVSDSWLGGEDNFEADRKAAEAIRRVRPNVAEQALDNREFQTRAVTLVASRGVRQLVDIGRGCPHLRHGRTTRRRCGSPPMRRPQR